MSETAKIITIEEMPGDAETIDVRRTSATEAAAKHSSSAPEIFAGQQRAHIVEEAGAAVVGNEVAYDTDFIIR
jgi:hypothetical protein